VFVTFSLSNISMSVFWVRYRKSDPSWARHLPAHLLERHVELVERARRQPLLLAQQAEQHVLGADVVVAQGARFLLGEDHGLPSPFGEALEHLRQPTPP